MKLIVGLGNPGREYRNTRHNVGFMVLDVFASYHNVSIDQSKFSGLYSQLTIDGEKVILLKPQKYMNLSGEVVRDFVRFFKIDVSDILVISDDLDMAIGNFKLKPKGSSGGHNGLKNIETHIGTQEYKRFKIGISNNKLMDTKDYVLGKFSGSDKEVLDQIIKSSVSILNDFINVSFDLLMNKYNGKK